MTTKDCVVAGFEIVGVALLLLTGLSIEDSWKDIIFFPSGIASYFIGMFIDRFWKPS